MLKGISTLIEYDQCLKKGLCEEHMKEINQHELEGVKNEFPKKAFKFVRINVLYPFLSNKPPKCEKMKKLMEKTPPIAKVLIDGKAERPISEEAAEVILIVDSVVIFTICQLSKICCIGAIFHTKKNSDESDPNIKAIQNLLLVERLSADIRYLYPVLQKNFIGFDLDIIRATHCIALLFIRKFCNKGSLKLAMEAIDNDIKTNCEFDQVTVICNEYNYKNVSCVIRKTSTSSSAPFNFYKPLDYTSASDYFYSAGKYELASIFGYLAVSLEDTVGDAYYSYVKALITQQLLKEASEVITYGIEHSEKNSKHYKKLSKLLTSLSKRINIVPEKIEATNNVQENSVIHNNIQEKILTSKKEKSKSELVDLVDSDSGGSDSELNKEPPELISDVVSTDNSSKTTEKKELLTEQRNTVALPQNNEDEKNRSSVDAKGNSACQDVPELITLADSDDESEIKPKKQLINGVKEKTKIKSSRRKRTVSEGSVDNQLDEEVDINKINLYLKEASEALLADCGYKAVQIFRGPLRKFIESSDFISFEECDIVCIKYSYGIAYCKSGGHDDLEKCITILKDIIEHHDSITFPAAHYSLGLAFRKLNRFKEALNYLEIVQNFLDRGIHFKVYTWPGVTTVIQETKPDILKNLVQDLIKDCENPPNPDAYCRFENCTFQPTIYYTDPDFKGYISLSCSEQCNLQYHLICWKTIKEEKNLTDKEFLERSCFTPDCEGYIAKIQNIDKKGDLSKEFTSEFKKPQKLPKKWDKKLDNKEKERKKKKTIVRSEEGSQEVLTENGKDRSRKSSVCDSETTESKKDYSRESSVCDNEISPLTGSCISNEEVSTKSECSQKLKQKAEVPFNSSRIVSSFLQDCSYTNHVEVRTEHSTPVQEKKSKLELRECIKDNAYSYLADILQHHGPLRIDDPLLTFELECFPEEISSIISSMGGIGEFLKTDMRFAIVGDLYVCFIDDLAKAYQMLSNASLPTDFKNLQTPESHEHTKYYCENGKISAAKQSSFLNPDAQEYTPSNKKDSDYKFKPSNSNEDFNSHLSLPLNLDSPYKYTSSVSQLDTFPASEIFVPKSKSCEAVSESKLQNNTESVLFSISKEKNTLVTAEIQNEPEMHSDILHPRSSFSTVPDNECINDSTGGRLSDNANLKSKTAEDQLLYYINQYISEFTESVHKEKNANESDKKLNQLSTEDMTENHQFLTSLKSYIIKKMSGSISTSTMTDVNFEESKNMGNTSTLEQDNIIEGLKKDICDLSKQNSSLQNVLKSAAEQQQKTTAELAESKKYIKELATKIEIIQKEFDKKEKDLLKEKVSLVQSLTDANKFVGSVQQKNATLAEEKLKLQKTIDNLTLTLKKEEEKFKNTLTARENIFNATVKSLEKDNLELKSRTKYAELQVLYMKKTEYLKKIEAKFFEVEEVKKEMKTPSMQLWANAAGPEQMKILTTKLNNYVDELKSLKEHFIDKIDEQVKKVQAGVSLKDLKEIEMKDLAPVPTYKSILPEDLLAGMSRFNSMTLPYFGSSTPTAVVPPVPTASLISPATSALKITPPSAAVTNIIPPVSPAIASKIIPPVTLAATSKIIPPVAPIVATNVIPPVTPSTTIIPSCIPSITPISLTSLSTSVPPVLNTGKDNKLDLVSDIDPTIQESFKSAMASINSFASTPYPVPSLDEEFDKNCVVFKHPDPVSNDVKPDHPKVPPGLVNSVPLSASARASAITPIPEPTPEASKSSEKNSYAGLDAVPKINRIQSTWEPEQKKTTASLSKLLSKLKDQFPSYSSDELLSFVKEVRAQRQGKLSGLTIDAIIAEISAIMKTKKKVSELKIQPKPAKVLVNKKLASDPPKPEPQTTTKKKTAWNIDTEAGQRKFSGSADDDCSICCDPMADSAYKVACGHFFHEDCIRQWLKKNSNCPICRVLLLLPEEYPSL